MKRMLMVMIIMVACLALPMASLAGVKLKIADDTNIDFGFRVQTQFVATNDNDGGTGKSEEFFNVRRARFRLGGNVTEYVKFFMQTDFGNKDAGVGADVRIIDAMVNLHYKDYVNLIMGEWMAPSGRQHLTSSGGLMVIDRPNITNFNLTWGLNGKVGFNHGPNFAQGDLALGNDVAVRDLGATLFGHYDFSDMIHGKYYIGVYDGIEATDNDQMRVAGRVQFNFFDPEPGYFNLSTYLGKKKTVGVGFSYDYQKNFANDNIKGDVDYNWFEVDAFVDYPVGPGSVTGEVGYINLDLDDATSLNTSAALPQDARQTQGDGIYVQLGYHFPEWKIQPWYGFDYWSSDASGNDIGSFTSHRFGLSYFFKGHNANVKVGYEIFNADEKIPGQEDNIGTFLIGFYVTY